MHCAVSFVTVIVFVIGVGVAAFLIILTSDPDKSTVPANSTCPDGKFLCKEDKTCIDKKKKCDGVQHCPEGSDEKPYNCRDTTNIGAFLNRNKGCGGGREGENFTHEKSYPKGCTGFSRGLYCNDTCWEDSVPWDKLELRASTWSLLNVLQIDHLEKQLVPTKNRVQKLYFEDNLIKVLGEFSICGWDEACYISLSSNSIEAVHASAFCEMTNLKWLTMIKNKFTLEGFKFEGMPNLKELFLQHNRIEKITEEIFESLPNLITLKLQWNQITFIHEKAFKNNALLIDLELCNNRLKQLAPLIFIKQVQLERLYLGNNSYETPLGPVFTPLVSLISLNVENIDFSLIDFSTLNNLTDLDFVEFSKFQYCRFLPKVSRCHPFSDGNTNPGNVHTLKLGMTLTLLKMTKGMSSLENLLAGKGVRWMVWIVSISTIGGNLMVLLSRYYLSNLNNRVRILDVFLNNLAVADFLMGVYLLVLAIKDIQFRNVYNVNAYTWGTSWLCSGIGILAMISSEVSLMILTLMSIERYLVISAFAYHKKLSLNLSRLSMLIIWVFVTALAIAPAIQWRGKLSFYGSSGLCFPVHLDDPLSMGWQYTSFVFIGLNSLCLIIVTLSYSTLYCVIRKTQLSTPIVVKDMEMTLRFFLMVFTDCICWLPIILLKIYTLAGFHIPKELITWVVVFVLPINSTINPYLYTLSMGEVRMKLFRRIIPTRAIRQARNIITLPLRRRGPSNGDTTWDHSNETNAVLNENKNECLRNPISMQESIASSNVSFGPH